MDMDAHSQRICLLVPNGPIGTERANVRPQVDLAPLPYDSQFDPIPLSEFPVRPSRMPIAIQSMGQYMEWSDGNNALKREFIQLYAGGALVSPSPPPEQYGGWMSYDEYRLSFIGARGSEYDA